MDTVTDNDGLARIVDTPYMVCDGFFRTCNMNLDYLNGNVSSRAPVSVVIQICRTLKEVLRIFMYIRCRGTTKPPSPGISAWYRMYLLLSLFTCCGMIKPQLMSTCFYTFSGMYRVDHGVCNVNTQSTLENKLISSLFNVNVSVLLMLSLSLIL